MCSSPTRLIMALRIPRRATPKARLPELPPRVLDMLRASSRRAPNCSAYRSTARRPRQARSWVRPAGNFKTVMGAGLLSGEANGWLMTAEGAGLKRK